MIAAILFTVSVAAFAQFALYYWRALVAGVAAQPISDRVQVAAGLAHEVSGGDFNAILSLHDVAPGLKGDQGGLRVVRVYYRAMEFLRGLHMPSLAAWSEREMLTCSRYVAVLLDQRLERNLACAAEVRSI